MRNSGEKRILIVEDDAHIAEGLRLNLSLKGYTVKISPDGVSGIRDWKEWKPELIVLDIMLPDIDGFEVCRNLRTSTRTSHVPIIFLTQKDERSDKLQGLELGADDYITKPFSMEELIFRIEAVLRRTKGSLEGDNVAHEIGKYQFDPQKQILKLGNTIQNLTTKETDLLKLLCNNKNRILERNFALKAIWSDDNYFNARSMDVYITKLRKYLKKDPSVRILNIHGKGYKLLT